MTEAEWLANTDPYAMLASLNMRLRGSSNRKGLPVNFERFRLFACTCCRRIEDMLDEQGRQVLERLERYTDDPERKELLAIRRLAKKVWQNARGYYETEEQAKYDATVALELAAEMKPVVAAKKAHVWVARAVCSQKDASWNFRSSDATVRESTFRVEYAAQAPLLRDIFGNQFRPVAVDPAWRTGNVIALAQTIYDERAFDRMPILADALEDAGCTSDDMLHHCRMPGEHVRGCWVVDLLLGKC